jgi:hypothetical protein
MVSLAVCVVREEAFKVNGVVFLELLSEEQHRAPGHERPVLANTDCAVNVLRFVTKNLHAAEGAVTILGHHHPVPLGFGEDGVYVEGGRSRVLGL